MDQSNPETVLHLLELTSTNAGRLLKGEQFYSKSTWEHTQNPISASDPTGLETHLYFKRLTTLTESRIPRKVEVSSMEAVCPKWMDLDTAAERQHYAMVLISGLSQAASQMCCANQSKTGFQNILSTQHDQKLKLVQSIHKLCELWHVSGNYLDSEEALGIFGLSIPNLQNMVNIFTRQPIDLQMAAQRLGVLLALLCAMGREKITDWQAFNQIMSTAAVYVVRSCREEILDICLKLMIWLDQTTTRFVSDGLMRADDRKSWLYPTAVSESGKVEMLGLGEIASSWDNFSADKKKSPTKIIALFQHCLENRIVYNQLNANDREYCSAELNRIQTLWSCVEVLCKVFSKCTFSDLYLYSEIFSLQEQILACRHAVLVEKVLLKCICTSDLHKKLRQALSNLFCNPNVCLSCMQVVYAEVYTIEFAGVSARLVVTASNIHKWFPFLNSRDFVQCLDTGHAAQNYLLSDKILCLHLGDPHEMNLIPSDKNLDKIRHLGNLNRSCLRHLQTLSSTVEKFITEQSVGEKNNSWLCDDDSGLRISQLQNLFAYACMRKKIRRRCRPVSDTQVNAAFRVNIESILKKLDNFQDVFCSEHSKFYHTPESLWRLPGSGSGSVLQLDKWQAALDIYSNFSGFSIDNRLASPGKTTMGTATRTHLSKRDVLQSSYGELHSHLSQDALESICKKIQALNQNDLGGQGDKSYADQDEVYCDIEPEECDSSDLLHAPQLSPKLKPLLQDSDRASDIMMLLNTPDHQLKNTPNAVKFSTGVKRKLGSVSKNLFYQQRQIMNFCEKTTMNKDEYYQLCRITGVIRLVQISNSNLDISDQQGSEYRSQALSVEAVLPNPNPNILVPLTVLIAQICQDGITSLYSSCCCFQCGNSDSKSATRTIVFFNSIKILHLRPLCMCVDVMQHVLKQCFGFLSESGSINKFCGYAEDSDSDLKIESGYSVIHQETDCAKVQLVQPTLKVVHLPKAVGVSISDANDKSFLSVIVQDNGSHEVSHALVCIGSVQKRRLKVQCRKKNLPETQLFCLRCDSFFVTHRGSVCRHNKAAHKFLYPPSNAISAESATAEPQCNSESEEMDDGSSSDDHEAVDVQNMDAAPKQTDFTENDTKSPKKQAPSSLPADKEYFDPDLAKYQTGYVMTPTLSSIQGVKVEFDVSYGQSSQMTAVIEKQKHWTLQQYLLEDKSMFDLCMDESFEGEFLPSDTCVHCSHMRNKESKSEEIKISPSTVYLSNCQICSVPAKYWYCTSCKNFNHYDGRNDGLWFYSSKVGVSVVLVLRQLKGFVRGTYPNFSLFKRNHDDIVQSAMNNPCLEFISEKIWRITCFSLWATFPDFRLPCSGCLMAAKGCKPANFRGETLYHYKRSAPFHVWDPPCLIQDAIANFVECGVRSDQGAGTYKSYPIEQPSSILDRCPIPGGGFITLNNGKHVYKNSLNATSEQRTARAKLREMFKSAGKNICELCQNEVVDLSTFAIKDLQQMKQLLQSAWHAKQKEAKTEHPFSLLLDVLNGQRFPAMWPYNEKVRFMYTCGILCQQLGAQASVLTLIKDWVVPKILKFSSCMSDTYCKLETSDMPIQPEDLQMIRDLRHELLESLAPNADSFPADPNIYQVLRFTSADADEFLSSHRDVNLAISSVLNYLAYCVCEISSRHKILIEGCESTGIFNLATDTQRYNPVLPLRSHLIQDEIGGDHSEISEAEFETEELAGYNPVKYNCALYFSPEAGQIRKVPHIGVVVGDKQDGDCTKKSYKDDAVLSQRNNADMLSILQCGLHCNVVGYTIIFKGEGRKDSYYPVAAYKSTGPAAFVYDNACG
jgi:hypothetical protein